MIITIDERVNVIKKNSYGNTTSYEHDGKSFTHEHIRYTRMNI